MNGEDSDFNCVTKSFNSCFSSDDNFLALSYFFYFEFNPNYVELI